MRKTLIIGLMVVHLFGNTELNQLFKVPELITHFFQHHRQDPDISFFEFIAMHYGGDDGTTADDFEDGKLPYHNSNSHSLTTSYTANLKTLFLSDEINPEDGKVYGSRLHMGTSSKHVLIVLQPPRLA